MRRTEATVLGGDRQELDYREEVCDEENVDRVRPEPAVRPEGSELAAYAAARQS